MCHAAGTRFAPATRMKNRLCFTLAIVALACGGSTDGANGSGGTAGTAGGGAGAAGMAGSVGGAAGGAGASGSAGIAGGAAFGGGGSGANAACDALQTEHAAALQAAKACPLNSTQPTCDTPIDYNIDGCGYYTKGDASNTDAINELSTVKAQWKDMGCDPTTVCAIGGYPPQPAHCEAGGQGGTTGTCVPN